MGSGQLPEKKAFINPGLSSLHAHRKIRFGGFVFYSAYLIH